MCSAGERCPPFRRGPACQPARKPLAGWRLPEGKRATLTRRPLPFLMLCFCGYCAYYCCSSSCSFLSSPVYGFSGRPLGGAGCRERSQRSCLRPDGLPSLTQNPGFAATGTVAPPLSRRGLRSRHPGKKRRDVRPTPDGVVAGAFLPLSLRCHAISFQPRRRGQKTATTVSASPGVKCTSRKTFCPKAGKNFCGLPPDSRFRPWQ